MSLFIIQDSRRAWGPCAGREESGFFMKQEGAGLIRLENYHFLLV